MIDILKKILKNKKAVIRFVFAIIKTMAYKAVNVLNFDFSEKKQAIAASIRSKLVVHITTSDEAKSPQNHFMFNSLCEDGFVNLIINLDESTQPTKYETIDHNLFITNDLNEAMSFSNANIRVPVRHLSKVINYLPKIKSLNNRVILDFSFISEIELSDINNNFNLGNLPADFVITDSIEITHNLQTIFPVDKILLLPNIATMAEDVNINHAKEALLKAIKILVPASSMLRFLPKNLITNDDKFLDVQAEIARSMLHGNNLYYRHCERLYFLPILSWFEEDLKGKKVLDIGCAYGALCVLMSKHFNADVYAIDFMDGYYPANLFKKYDIKFKCANVEVEEIPYEEKFNLVILTEVLEHFNFYPVPTLRKIAKSMEDGGVLIITTPDSSEWGITTKHYNSLNSIPLPRIQESYIDDHVWQYNKDELAKVVKEAGFEIKKFDYAPGMPNVGRHFCVKLQKIKTS